MDVIKKNKAVLLKIGVFIAYLVLYILLQCLYNFVQMLPYYYWSYGNEINDAAYFDLISGNQIMVVLYVIIFVQWALLGVLFYFLSLKQKARSNFSVGWLIVFLCLVILYSLGTWGYYLNFLEGAVRYFFLGLFADESRFLCYIIPALSGFFLMQSLFDTDRD